MTRAEAESAANAFQEERWDVTAHESPLSRLGWELRARPTEGGRDIYAFSRADMRDLVAAGRVATLKAPAP